MSRRKRVGVLISGRGSNMASLIEACKAPDYPAEIAVVISNRPGAPGLAKAAEAGIATQAIDHTAHRSRQAFEQVLDGALRDAGAELICNAGFMRLLTEFFVDRWRDRQLNIHPSLLPAFKGLDTHQRVLEAGAMITGCTVHFVRLETDSGPIIAQAAVPVQSDDTAETLAVRVLVAEHKLYPLALKLVASGAAEVKGERVIWENGGADGASLFWPPIV